MTIREYIESLGFEEHLERTDHYYKGVYEIAYRSDSGYTLISMIEPEYKSLFSGFIKDVDELKNELIVCKYLT